MAESRSSGVGERFPLPMKWAGGKRAMMKTIFEYLPVYSQETRTFEPFCGSSAFSIAIDWGKTKVVSDINKQLIWTLRTIQEQPERLSSYLKRQQEHHDGIGVTQRESHYYRTREIYNKMIDSGDPANAAQKVQLATTMIYLNRACYNGLYRVNKSGHFNVPYGDGKISLPKEEQIKRWSKIMWNWSLKNIPFWGIEPQYGDFVFCDPPYYDVFSDYTRFDFWPNYGALFIETLRKWHKDGVKFLVTINDVASARNIFSEWDMYSVDAPRLISRDASGRQRVGEIIVVNYSEFGDSINWGRTRSSYKKDLKSL